MSNSTLNTYQMKQKILSFSGKISRNLPKPESVPKEVSIPHLRRYIPLISSAWNSFSERFVMMFS